MCSRLKTRDVCYNTGVRRLTGLIAAFALLTQTAACAHGADRRFMINAERALNHGVDAWEETIDATIESCRARLPNATEVQRRECVREVDDLDRRVVEPSIVAIVASLQIYWTASGAGDDETAQDALERVARLVEGLPPEVFDALGAEVGEHLRKLTGGAK